LLLSIKRSYWEAATRSVYCHY